MEAVLHETAVEVAASRKEAGLARKEVARCKKELAASQALCCATPRRPSTASTPDRKSTRLNSSHT